MKYAFVFTKPEDGTSFEIEGGRSALWEAQEKAAGWPDRVTNQNRLDFAWAYVASARAGKLKELGLDGMEFDEAVEALADTYDVLIKDNKPDAPLADARPE